MEKVRAHDSRMNKTVILASASPPFCTWLRSAVSSRRKRPCLEIYINMRWEPNLGFAKASKRDGHTWMNGRVAQEVDQMTSVFAK